MKDAHIGSNPAQNGWPIILIFMGCTAQQFGPFTDSVFDMTIDNSALRTPYQRTDDGVRLTRIADLKAFGDRDEPLTKHIEDWLFDENARISHANLALVKEDTECGCFDRVIDIRIAQNDQWALASHLKRETLESLGGFHGEMPSGLRRAGKCNHPHTGIGENGGSDFGRRAGNNAEQAWRKSRLVKDLGNLEASNRGKLRGLQDEPVTRRQRHDHLLHGEKKRCVERRDAGDHTQWLTYGEPELPGCRQRHGLARRPAHFRRGRTQQVEAVPDLEARLAGNRPGFGNKHVGNLLDLRRENIGGTEKYCLAFRNRHRGPSPIGLVRSRDSALRFCFASLLHASEKFAGRRIHAVRQLIAQGARPLAGYIKIVVRRSINHLKWCSHQTLLMTNSNAGDLFENFANRPVIKPEGATATG